MLLLKFLSSRFYFQLRMASNSTQMNYSSKVGSSSMTSTSNTVKDVYVDAMVWKIFYPKRSFLQIFIP